MTMTMATYETDSNGVTQALEELMSLFEDVEVGLDFTEEYISVPTAAPQLVWTDPFDIRVSLANVAWTKNAAIVELLVEMNGGEQLWVVEGTSKRLSGDQANAQLGIGLAVGRAFENLSRQIMRQANGLVKHNDDNRQKRKEAAAAKIRAQVTETKKPKKAKAAKWS